MGNTLKKKSKQGKEKQDDVDVESQDAQDSQEGASLINKKKESKRTERETKLEPMSEAHKTKLRKNRMKIMDSLQNVAHILDYLVEKECLSEGHQEIIMSHSARRDQVRSLLDHLRIRSDLAYCEFLSALCETQDTAELYQVLKDDEMPDILGQRSGPPTVGAAKKYYEDLKRFHEEKLESLSKQKDQGGHDLSTHISLTLHSKESVDENVRKGLGELSLDKKLITPILPTDLFAKLQDDAEPRSVLMLGAPGVGKTATCFFFLQEHTHQRLWNSDFNFVIFILLREINYFKIEISFQDLLFNCYGPPLKDKTDLCSQVWGYLESHQEEILVILDGFDETSGLGVNIDKTLQVPFSSTQEKTHVQILLHNLIVGRILPKAKLLISGRPHIVGLLKNKVNRTVEVLGLDIKKLEQMAGKVFEDRHLLGLSVVEYLRSHGEIANMCSSPTNAKGLLNYIKASHNNGEHELVHDCIPKSRAGLMYFLILNLLRNHDQELKEAKLSSSTIVQRRQDLLRQLADMAYEGLFSGRGTQPLFDEEDIAKHRLSIPEVLASGLMSGHPSSVSENFWEVEKIFLQFPHLTYHEFFAALKLSQAPISKITSIISKQRGEKDVALTLCLGAMTDSACQELLVTLYPGTPTKDYMEKAEQMLRAISSAPCSCQNDGPLYTINALSETGMYSMADEVSKKLLNVFDTLNLSDCTILSSDLSPVGKFLEHLSKPCFQVALSGSINTHGLHRTLKAGSFKGLSLFMEISTQILKELAEFLHENLEVQQLSLHNWSASEASVDWSKFHVTNKSSLQCLRLSDIQVTSKMQGLWESLAQVNSLIALDFYCCPLSPLTLPHLPCLRYLTLRSCHLVAKDMRVVADTVPNSRIVSLDVSLNAIRDEGAAILAKCLQNSHTALVWFLAERCELTDKGLKKLCKACQKNTHLKSLHLTDNKNLEDVSHFAVLLSDSLINEVHIGVCSITADMGCQLAKCLSKNTSLSVLDLHLNVLKSAEFACCLRDALKHNKHLLMLNLNACGLGDDSIDQIKHGLAHNSTLKLLDIAGNTSLTSTSIEGLLADTNLQHLSVARCQLGKLGLQKVAQALIQSPSVCSFMIGDPDMANNLEAFVEEFIATPQSSSLQHLFFHVKSMNAVAPLLHKLRTNTTCTVTVTEYPLVWHQFAGLMQQHVPPSIRHWISTVYQIST